MKKDINPKTSEESENKCDCEKECSCDEKEQKIQELTIDLKRVQAEFENYQKRTERQNEEFKAFASASLISDLLPVIDSLEQGIKHNKELVQIYEQLFSVLQKKGLKKIEVNVGDEFDHEKMDCLMQETNETLQEGQVVQVLSTGYLLNNKILRTTKISINKISEKKENCEKNNQSDEKENEKMEENN